MQEIKKKKRAVALFVIVLICLCGWWAVRKEGFFLDEIYSYGLANSSYRLMEISRKQFLNNRIL